jgi:riboflavin synthase
MFTGIVEHKGSVVAAEGTETGRTLSVDVGPLDGIEVGDSVSVSGVCLTAVDVEDSLVTVEVVKETLDRSSLGALSPGSTINLERAMPASGRFDGHVVQGHVDGVGTVLGTEPEGSGIRMTVEIPRDLLRYVVEKGSITIDGVSLTVAALADESIEIALIPHTLSATTLGLRNVGDWVNLEVDILAKYIERIMKSDQ